jgi:hypothetical protein
MRDLSHVMLCSNSAGAITKGWLIHADMLDLPSSRASSTNALLNTFAAANGYGWTRGVATSDLTASGTRSAGARLRSGTFGTGASTLSGNVAAITDLPVGDVVAVANELLPCFKPRCSTPALTLMVHASCFCFSWAGQRQSEE